MIGFSFGLTPKEALSFFAAKGLEPRFAWQDMLHEAHDHGFTVAKMMDLDLLSDTRAIVQQAIAEGWTFQRFKDELKPRLIDAGWWGRQDQVDPATGEVVNVQLGSSRRLRTIYDTNLRTAHAAGAWERILKNVETAPYLMYVAVDDNRTRPAHAAWSHKIYRWDDPWWETHFPPNGWNCRCFVIQLSARDLAKMGLTPDDIKPAPPVEMVPWTNPRTGEVIPVPKGVDPGWGYHPGRAANQALLQTAIDKMAAAPAELGATAYASMANQLQPVLEKAYGDWLDVVLADSVSRGRLQLVGILSPETVTWLAQMKSIEPISAEVAIPDSLIVGAKAVRHQSVGDALTPDEWRQLVTIIANPDQVLFDTRSGKLLFVAQSNDPRRIKIAVEFDFQQKRQKGAVNLIVSAFKPQPDSIDGGIRGGVYEVVK